MLKKFFFLDFIILLFLSMLPYFRLFSPYTSYGYGDYHYASIDSSMEWQYLSLWRSEYGLGSELGPFTINAPILYVISALSSLAGHTQFFEHLIVILLPLLVGILSLYCLMLFLFKSRIAAISSSLIFAVNSYILDRISMGHMFLLPAYLLSPLILLLIVFCVTKQHIKWPILLGLVWGIACMFDLRSAYIISILCGIWITGIFIWGLRLIKSKHPLIIASHFLISILIVVGLLSYFWLPIIQGLSSSLTPSKYHTSIDWFFALSKAKSYSVLSFKSVIWSWDKPEAPWLHILPIMASIGIFTHRKNPYVFGFLVTYCVGVFLSKGIQPPLGSVYLILKDYIPGFNAFRDPIKFYALIGIGIAPLAGLGFKIVVNWIPNRFLRNAYVNLSKIIFIIVSGLIFIVLMSDAYLQQIGGGMVSYDFPPWQKAIEKKQIHDTKFYRTIWGAYPPPIAPRSGTHPLVSIFHLPQSDFNPFAIYPFSVAEWDKISDTSSFSYLLRPSTVKIFEALGIKYIYLPDLSYVKKVFNEKYWEDIAYQQFGQDMSKEFIESGLGLRARSIDQNHPIDDNTFVYEIPQPKDHIYVSQKATYVIGNNSVFDSIYTISPNLLLAPVIRLNDTNLNFSNQRLFYESNSFHDLWFEFMSKQVTITYPAIQLREEYQASQQWRIVSEGLYQQFLQNYQGEVIFESASKSGLDLLFSLSNIETNANRYGLWVWLSKVPNIDAAMFEVSLPSCQDKPCDFSINNTSDKLGWHRLGEVSLHSGTHIFSLKSLGLSGRFAAFALVPLNIEYKAKERMLEVIQTNYVALSVPFKSNNLAEFNMLKAGIYTLKVELKMETPSQRAYSTKEVCISLYERVSAINLPIQCVTTPQSLYSTVHLSFGDLPLSSQHQEWQINISDKTVVSETHLLISEKGFTISSDTELSMNLPKLTYDRLSSTQYKVRIQQLQQPFYLVFSEAFSSNWHIILSTGKVIQPVRAYGLIQSYFIEYGDNSTSDPIDIIIEYVPQQHVIYGFMLSGLTLTIILFVTVNFSCAVKRPENS